MVTTATDSDLGQSSDSTTPPPLVLTGDDDGGTLADQLRAVWSRRDLIANLTRREVTARHKNSVIGLAWNLLNPLLQMSIYTVVFTYLMPGRVANFPLKLLSGMAIFGLFRAGVAQAATSITGNSALVLKIWFPREILPLAAVASKMVTFASQATILAVGLLIYWHPPEWSMMGLAVFAVFVTVVLTVGVGLLLATANVYFRDTQHFLELALMALFWLTPVIWSYDYLAARVLDRFGPVAERMIAINPLIAVTNAFQRVLYNPAALPPEDQAQFELILRPASWHFTNLVAALIISIGILLVGLKVFRRFQGSFAETL